MKKILKWLFHRYAPLSDWQKVFMLSRVNGAPYIEPTEHTKWTWPRR